MSSVDPNGNTALHFSSANGHNGVIFTQETANGLDIIRILLQYPQSISPQNSAGNTPLHWACLNNQVDTVKLLVQEGAGMFLKNSSGKDAVWEAQQRGNEELVGWMLAFGEEQVVGQTPEEDVPDVELEKEVEMRETVNGESK